MRVPAITRAARRREAVLATVDAYAEWRRRCTVVDQAYRRWNWARGAGRGPAFSWYCTALDAEERAAHCYAQLVTAHRGTDEITLLREIEGAGRTQ
jgi:hypothetical protein